MHGHEIRGWVAGGRGHTGQRGAKGKIGTTVLAQSIKYVLKKLVVFCCEFLYVRGGADIHPKLRVIFCFSSLPVSLSLPPPIPGKFINITSVAISTFKT